MILKSFQTLQISTASTAVCSVQASVLSFIRTRTQTDTMYLIIMDIFECVADNTDSHVDQVRRGYFKDLLRELLTVLVNFLRRERYTVYR